MSDLKYYAVLYLHWYPKDHKGEVKAVYSTKAAAINHINHIKKETKYFHVNHDKTFLAEYQVKPTNYKELQYDIYMVYPVNVKKETGMVTLKLNVTFPDQVSCMEGENEKYDYVDKLHNMVKEHINITALDKHTDKNKHTFSADDSVKNMEFSCNCMVKQ